MADALLSLEQVCKELQLGQEQVVALVKQGALRGFLDGGSYKFRKADVDKYKQDTETSATVVFEPPSKPSGASDSDVTDLKMQDASKIDLADIESEAGADESDQTSVLAPVDEADQVAQSEEQPVFEFSEKELGLSLDDDETGDSLLAVDESDSSLDILEVADESSSDTSTSAADLDFMDESSSGEDVAAVLEVEEESPVRLPATDAGMDAGETATVTDILGGADDTSDEELETLDLDDVVETQETLLDDEPVVEVAGIDALDDDIPVEIPATDTAETLAVGDELETVGLGAADATMDVGEAEPMEGDDLAEAEREYEPAHVATGYELVTPSMAGNVFLVLAVITMAFAASFFFAEVCDFANHPLTDVFAKHVTPFVDSIGK